MTTLERAEAAERAMSGGLDRVVVKSVLFTSGEQDPTKPAPRPPDRGKRYMMGPDPRLPRMPDKPTLLDFFKYRFAPANHLLHDTAIAGFIRSDHGYWGAQLLEPYGHLAATSAGREARGGSPRRPTRTPTGARLHPTHS